MYTPKPINTDGVELPQELLALSEKIAENVHENWARSRLAEGWTYGEVRNDAAKTTPCLVPYEQLPESEKAYDRRTAFETLKLIVAMGYRIEKAERVMKMNNAQQYIDSFKMKHEAFLVGCDAIEEMGLWDKEAHGEMDVFYSNDLTGVIIRLIATDGKISQKEVDYLNETFDFEYTLEELTEVYENCLEDVGQAFDENFENGITCMRAINAKLADAYKELLGLICTIIIESDGVVAEAELAEVRRLKALCD